MAPQHPVHVGWAAAELRWSHVAKGNFTLTAWVAQGCNLKTQSNVTAYGQAASPLAFHADKTPETFKQVFLSKDTS